MNGLHNALRTGLGTAVLTSLVCFASPSQGQTELGGQRVGTSSGTFLKIGLDARGASLGGSFVALVDGPIATFYNPAGLGDADAAPAAQFSYVNWPADINIGSVSYSRPLEPLGGRIGIGFAFLGAEFDETTEYNPLGTGRKVGYSNFLATASFSRFFTDRLSIGITAKYFREDLASNVGGPTTVGVLFDAGTVYQLGYRNARLAITLAHFGPDLEPTGTYLSNASGSIAGYSSFAPPTLFQLGISIDPLESGPHRMSLSGQVVHPADQSETMLAGVEYWFQERYAARGGYDFTADEMGFSAGLGFKVTIGDRDGIVDYAITEGGNLATVHRLSFGFSL